MKRFYLSAFTACSLMLGAPSAAMAIDWAGPYTVQACEDRYAWSPTMPQAEKPILQACEWGYGNRATAAQKTVG